MIKANVSITLIAVIFSASSYAMSPDAVEGKMLYPACETCHDPALNPPKGPPMWRIQRLYKRQFPDNEAFINNIVAFVKEPSLKTAIHREAVNDFGLMPPMLLPDDMLQKIATYILEEEFPPPCDYWKNAMTRTDKKKRMEQVRWNQKMHRRHCSQN